MQTDPLSRGTGFVDPFDPRADLRETDPHRDDELRCLGASDDGKDATYAYRGHVFTITRTIRTWWCHSGASRPGEMLCMAHEAGWASLSRRSILRKLRRAIDRRLRDEGRRIEAEARAERV